MREGIVLEPDIFETVLIWFTILFFTVVLIRVVYQHFFKNQPRYDLVLCYLYLLKLGILLLFFYMNYDLFLPHNGSMSHIVLLYIVCLGAIAFCLYYVIGYYHKWKTKSKL